MNETEKINPTDEPATTNVPEAPSVAAPESGKLVAGIQYKSAGKIYTFEVNDHSLIPGDHVIVESNYGPVVGKVIVKPRIVENKDLPKSMKKVLRKASDEDLIKDRDLREKAGEVFLKFKAKVEEHNLPMTPLTSDIVENGKKIIFTFFSEDRIDFRALVKELAAILHMRIEMRQVGARDEAKITGGLGTCGLVTCCSKHLRQFKSISIQMAKTQNLMPNPAKLTGGCGKLKCCLEYENSQYAEIRKTLPKAGSIVETPQGDGKVVDLDILKKLCVIRLEEGNQIKIPADQVTVKSEKEKNLLPNNGKQTKISQTGMKIRTINTGKINEQ